MPTEQYPGVYVQELPGARSITGWSGIAVFVGSAEAGPGETPTLVTSWNQYVATFGGFVWGAQMPFAVYAFFVEGGSACYVVRTGSNPAATPMAAGLTAGSLQFSAASPGVWGDSLAVTITNTTGLEGTTNPVFSIEVFYRLPGQGADPTVSDLILAAYAQSNQLPTETIGGQAWVQVETFSGCTAADLQGAPSAIETRINQTALFIRVAATAASRPPNLAQPTALSGGAGDPAPTSGVLATALQTLDAVDGIGLLCLPDTPWIADIGLQRATVAQTLSWCEARPHSDMFYIAEPPFGLSVPDIDAFKTGAASPDMAVPAGNALQSSCGALYYPWITVLVPAANANVPIPPGGAMAGRYAATDTSIGVWKAPAGLIDGALSIATGVTQIVTDADQAVLNPDGVNAIRPITNYGICAWGARTLSDNPEFTYISVRRLLTMIEQSVCTGLQWVVFEPNNPQLWASVTQDVSAFLTTLWQAGALFGSTPAEAFQVRCDASNNPPESQAQGQLYVDIMVAPTYPAEFVVIRIQQATLANA